LSRCVPNRTASSEINPNRSSRPSAGEGAWPRPVLGRGAQPEGVGVPVALGIRSLPGRQGTVLGRIGGCRGPAYVGVLPLTDHRRGGRAAGIAIHSRVLASEDRVSATYKRMA